MNRALSPYLAQDRSRALAQHTLLRDPTQGSALFADLFGFTALAETLGHTHGPRRGAEELSQQLNQVYDALIAPVEALGGSVVAFAGDAITCWFDAADGTSAQRALRCAQAMQAAMHSFTGLALRVGVVSGPVRRLVVGEPMIQQFDLLAGETLTRLVAAAYLAEEGDVALDTATLTEAGVAGEEYRWRTEPATGEAFAIVRSTILDGLRYSSPEGVANEDRLPVEQLRPWLLPAVYERLQAGYGEFLTELRPAMTLFLHFSELDYDHDATSVTKLDAFVRWVQGVVTNYGGSVLHLGLGDKGSHLQAVFGAPTAQGGDARRTVAAAQVLRTPPSSLPWVPAVHVGISLGTMRAGAYGGSTRRTYGVLGDDVNLAARLMQAAGAGQVLGSDSVQQATASHFTWQPLPPLSVKGKREPVTVWALLNQGTGVVLYEPAYTLPMVGRDAERSLIEAALERARQGSGHLLGVTGEPGMGKSRLVAEAIRLAHTRGVWGVGGACQAHDTHTPYLPWHSIFRALFGLEAGATVESHLEQLERTMRELNPALLPRLPLLGVALDLPIPDNELTASLDAPQRRKAREALLVDCFTLLVRAQPSSLLFVLEDIHWADALSLELLTVVAPALAALPVLGIISYRPPEQTPTAASSEGEVVPAVRFVGLSEIHLSELSAAEARALLTARLGQGDLPSALIERIVAHAQGNPFYLEELLHYLQERRLTAADEATIEQMELPDSLHQLVLSRVDHLSERQKSTLKVASIIGRIFPVAWLLGYYPTLGVPTEVLADLEALRRLDLTPLERPDPELTYLFKHMVTHEVAYQSLPYALRATLHEQFASFLEQALVGSGELPLALLAYHYQRSENVPKKREYLRRAGDAAKAAYALPSARLYYEQLLPLLNVPAEQVEARLALGRVLEVMGEWEEAEAHVQAALALAERHEGVGWAGLAQVRAQRQLGGLSSHRRAVNEAIAWLQRAQAEAAALGDAPGARELLAEVQVELGRILWLQGAYEAARAQAETGLTLANQVGEQQTVARALNLLGNLTAIEGNLAEARALYEQSLKLRRASGERSGIAGPLNNLGVLAFRLSDYPAAHTLLTESLTLLEALGDRVNSLFPLLNLGHVLAAQGEGAQACQHYAQVLQRGQALGFRVMLPYALVGLAAEAGGRLQQGNVAAAQRAARLIGATESLLGQLEVALDGAEQAMYERTLANLRSLLPPDALESELVEGRAMTLERALAYALEEVQP